MRRSIIAVTALAGVTHTATAQHAHAGVGAAERATSTTMDSIAMRHMELTPLRTATRADSARALGVVKELRDAIAKYHVNRCVPGKKSEARWRETSDGKPVFGPESPIATKPECNRVGGRFEEAVFGWMLHANVFAGDELSAIFGDHHARPHYRH